RLRLRSTRTTAPISPSASRLRFRECPSVPGRASSRFPNPTPPGTLCGYPSAHNGFVTAVIPAEGAILERVLDATCGTSHSGLNRQAYGKFHAARTKTSWGSRYQRTFALVDGNDILASADRYDLAGVFDGRALRVCGLGSVWSEPSRSGTGRARLLIDTLLDNAAKDGAEIALLFSQAGVDADFRNDFQAIPLTDLTLGVTESPRHGAPMTMARGGEERALSAIVAMGRIRAEHLRFHLDRDIDFLKYAITATRRRA